MTKLILGSPGTGKTTWLLNQLDAELKLTMPEQVAYVSFTRAAVNEAKDRVLQRFNLDQRKLIYFRTLHSMAFKLIGIRQGQMLSHQQIRHFEQVMRGKGIDVQVGFDEDETNTIKNEPLYLYQLARSSCQPLTDVHRKHGKSTTLAETKHIIEAYEAFKAYYKVIDFTDLLVLAVDKLKQRLLTLPTFTVAFLDEAQDLSRLQWELVELLFKDTGKLFIAGDDDQAIYEWAGVDVNTFLNLTYDDKVVLTQGHRLPDKIKQVGDRLLKRIKHRYDKPGVMPTNEVGEVQLLNTLDELNLTPNEKVFILVRNRCFASTVKQWLLGQGVPFTCFEQPSINYRDIKAISLWEQYRKGLALTKSQEALIAAYVEGDKTMPWFEAFTHLDFDTITYYRRLLENGYKLTSNPTVHVNTIHHSKGQEADVVVLLLDQTQATYEGSQQQDAEHRVFYVGATRAKRKLYLLEMESLYAYQV